MITDLALVALGFALALAFVAALAVRRGEWNTLDEPGCRTCDGRTDCVTLTRRGLTRWHKVRWRVRFRCYRCDARWLRRPLYRRLHALAVLGDDVAEIDPTARTTEPGEAA